MAHAAAEGRCGRPDGFGDGGLHFRIVGGLGGGEALLQKGDIGINGGQAVEPVAAEPGEFADGDVRDVDALGLSANPAQAARAAR